MVASKMNTTSRKRFGTKIIISYAVLGLLGIVATFFIYREVKSYLASDVLKENDEKLLMISSLLSEIYETENLSKLTLQQNSKKNLSQYSKKLEDLKTAIDSLKTVTNSDQQVQVLDSVALLLKEKANSNAQLAKIRNQRMGKNTLDSLLEGFEEMEKSIGKITPESFAPNYAQLSGATQKTIRDYVAYLNENIPKDSESKDHEKKMDSVFIASKELLAKAKQERIHFKRGLAQKEMALFKTDLELSRKLQRMIYQIEQEVTKNSLMNEALKQKALNKSIRLAGLTAFIALFIVILFTFLIKHDFFKMQQLKNRLEHEKKYSDSLLKSREQLIAAVSHDLRTPLNTITGYTELLESTVDKNKQLGYLKSIRSASEYVENLVNDLLDYSQIEAGKIILQKKNFNLKHLIEDTASENEKMYSKKGVDLLLQIDPIFNRPIFGDPTRMKQILSNLIANAFKFTQKGHVAVKAFIAHNRLNIKVTDTGIGIKKGHQEKIFQEFSQVESNAHIKSSGYGLGLTISKQLALLLDGDITVKSEKRQGSSFTITLPMSFSDNTLSEESESTQLPSTILVIDDDTSLSGLVVEICSQKNLNTLIFNDFNRVPKNKELVYDMVLTDIQMPTVDGFGVLYALQSGQYCHYKDQPIIAMTGDYSHTTEKFHELGFSAVLHKPFSKTQLLQKLLPQIHDQHQDQVIPENEQFKSFNTNLFYVDTIASFLENDQKAINDVLQTFLENTHENMLVLKKAVKKYDIDQINKIAHRMLPMLQQLKAKETVALLKPMEKLEVGFPKKELMKKFEVLAMQMEQLQQEIEKYLHYTLSL